MENLEWYPVFYNGYETNVEITKCGLVRKIKHDWVPIHGRSFFGNYDFEKVKLHPQGYKGLCVQVKDIGRKFLFVHQLVCSVFHNYKFGSRLIVVDHINGIKLDNNYQNLRVVTQRENISSYHTLKNRLLPTGVIYIKDKKRYKAGVSHNKKSIHLGYYDNAELAHEAYIKFINSL